MDEPTEKRRIVASCTPRSSRLTAPEVNDDRFGKRML
jgi:hypothetical protein